MNKIADDQQEILWSPERTSRLVQGTVATGAGLSLLAILMDQIRSERRKTMASEKGRVLDEGTGTLTITPPSPTFGKKKYATFTEWIGGGAAGLGTYWLLQKAYQELRKKQLQKEIEEEEAAYSQSLQDSVNPEKFAALNSKVATNMWEIISGALQDSMILPGLLSAAGTYGLMEHTWPRVKEKAEGTKPNKIVVKGYGTVIADGPGDGPLAQLDKERGKQMVDDTLKGELPAEVSGQERRPSAAQTMAKAAALVAPVGEVDYKCAAEMLTFLLCEYPQLKEARSALPALIAAHASSPAATVEILKEAGVEAAIESSKGNDLAYYAFPHFEKRAAIHQAFSSPVLAPALATLAVAELAEVDSDLAKRAMVLNEDPEMSLMCTKAAALFWQGEILAADPSMLKTAASKELQNDMRRQMGTLSISESKDSDGTMDEADAAYKNSGDPIDAFLAGKK